MERGKRKGERKEKGREAGEADRGKRNGERQERGR